MLTLRISTVGALLILAACSGGSDESASEPAPSSPVPPVDRFASVDAAVSAAFVAQGLSGMGLKIYDATGTQVFERMYGAFSAHQRVAIASASKLVSGVTIFRLIDKGYLSLDSTTAEVLGWTGTKGSITLRHLLSFTSGLEPSNSCTLLPNITLAACVESIESNALVAAPGTRFDYGSTHLHVAARMAEVRVGASWNAIFDAELQQPLQLPDLDYYTAPLQTVGMTNPLIAGGLRASMNEYASVLRLVYDKGRWDGIQLAPAALFDAQAIEPFPAAVIGNSPIEDVGPPYRYGLTAWLECATPATGCASISSPGAFGFTPWIDRAAGYYAILGMEYTNNSAGVVSFAVQLEQQLKPMIATAMTQ